MKDDFNDGVRVLVAKDSKIYATYDNKNSIKTVSGEYFVYSSRINNNRIRITDTATKIGKPCAMTGWVSIDDITVVED